MCENIWHVMNGIGQFGAIVRAWERSCTVVMFLWCHWWIIVSVECLNIWPHRVAYGGTVLNQLNELLW